MPMKDAEFHATGFIAHVDCQMYIVASSGKTEWKVWHE